jgi:methylmalonyl-CoA mutase
MKVAASRSSGSPESFRRQRVPVRVLTAVPICDGHDSPIITVNFELVQHGVEVIYLGYHRSVRDIVRAAIQEDVRAIGISSYNGGHIEFFTDVLRRLRQDGADDIGVFGGGGGTITPEDARIMKRRGVDEIFFAGTPLAAMVDFVKRYGKAPSSKLQAPEKLQALSFNDGIGRRLLNDRLLARVLTAAENGRSFRIPRSAFVTPMVGVTGPGGAGKTTLIDELVLRWLRANPKGRLAILSHDPSLIGAGALLGDRAAMIYSQDDRVFMRSIGTRGQAGGLARATEKALEVLQVAGFDLIIVETAGIGQEALPFRRLGMRSVLVMSPDYGSRLQLQKIAMLDAADIVVVNKADLPGAKTAAAEIEQRLTRNGRGQALISTRATRHGDHGVDRLFEDLQRILKSDESRIANHK